MAKHRVDRALVEAGLAESRSQAQRLIMAGQVRADGELVVQSSQLVDGSASLEVDHGPAYVSRGGGKLEAGLRAFSVRIEGSICADVGSSTGGFTDCLLQHGAQKVYAVDVGKGQLHWKLRQDARVVVLEGINVRYLERLPEAVDLVTVDVSFISLKLVLPVTAGWLVSDGQVIALVKPQFEAGRSHVRKGGVVRDPRIRRQAVEDVIATASQNGLHAAGLIQSPLIGPKGNVEFLLWLQQKESSLGTADLLDTIFHAQDKPEAGDPSSS